MQYFPGLFHNDTLQSLKSEMSKEKRFRERLEEEVKDLKNEIMTRDMEIQSQSGQIAQNNKLMMKMELHLREQKVRLYELGSSE